MFKVKDYGKSHGFRVIELNIGTPFAAHGHEMSEIRKNSICENSTHSVFEDVE